MPRKSTSRRRTKRNSAELLLMGGNPRHKRNPAELLLMSANPGRRRRNASSVYDALPLNERLAFGRLGLGKAQIQTESDVARARRMVRQANTLRNRLPNPAADAIDTDDAAAARDLRESFSGEPSKRYQVRNEPHVPAGDYSDCGEFIAIAVKPTASGELNTVQEISFPGKRLEWICDPGGTQLYIVGGDQDLDESDLRIFTSERGEVVHLGECRVMSYGMVKWGSDVAASARGVDVRWDHQFGEEGGTCPQVQYDTKTRRLLIGRATYRIEGAWVRN